MSQLAALAVLVAIALPGPLPTPAALASAPRMESASPSTARSARININTAGVKELMTLEGVGRGLAEKIVKHREQHGLFKKADDLRRVDGVGDALVDKNRERIVVK